jgi:hypothetical protein
VKIPDQRAETEVGGQFSFVPGWSCGYLDDGLSVSSQVDVAGKPKLKMPRKLKPE